MELLSEHFEALARKHAEAEARKTPEQKAEEKRQAEASRQAALQAKAENINLPVQKIGPRSRGKRTEKTRPIESFENFCR